MRVFISVDMEGMPGVYCNEQVDPNGPRYAEGREVMTDVTRLVCEELHKNGVNEILVADSHDGMGNIYYEKMPEYVSIVRGASRPIDMMFGIDRGFDAAVFLGYHAAAGSLHASFDHTYSGRAFSEILINGKKASEFYFGLLIAGRYKVPVILVGGDDILKLNVKEEAPWANYMTFKEAVSRHSNITPSFEKVKTIIKEGVTQALGNLKNAKPVTMSPLVVTFKLKNTKDADVVELIPGLKRAAPYIFEYKCKDITEAYRMMQLISELV